MCSVWWGWDTPGPCMLAILQSVAVLAFVASGYVPALAA